MLLAENRENRTIAKTLLHYYKVGRNEKAKISGFSRKRKKHSTALIIKKKKRKKKKQILQSEHQLQRILISTTL